MKKIIITITLILLLSATSNVQADLSTSKKNQINKVVKKIEAVVNKKGIRMKDAYVFQVEKLLKKQKKGSDTYLLLEYLMDQLKKISLQKHADNHYKKYKINMNEVKSFWLNLHNTERNTRGLPLYSYDKRLDNTAYLRSIRMGLKGKMDHKRIPNDSFYNYPVIENWFQDRGVNCKVINGLTTSESIAKYSFYCPKGDCTEVLKESLEEIFTIYMDEEGLSYPANAHFRGIIHPNISKMGVGLYVEKVYETGFKDFYDYYITTHYCSSFKK